MADYMQQLAEAPVHAPVWLQDTVRRGRARAANTALPGRKQEAWKYTSLHSLERRFSAPEPTTASLQELGLDYPDLGGNMLVFVDGTCREDLSRVSLPSGCDLLRFRDANDTEATAIAAHLGTAVRQERHLFAPANDATLADGVFLRLAPGTQVEAPIHILWLSSGRDPACSINQRLLAVLGEGSSATLVEHFASGSAPGTAFTNGITELLLQRGARLEHYRLQLERDRAIHIGGVHARLAERSQLNALHLALGSDLKRLDLVVEYCGVGAECTLNGIYLPAGSEHIDYHTCIEHAVPGCTSNEVFRGIVRDEARAVFNGRIHIHPGASKTRAQLSNRNLLTSARAEVNTKPELEIYADDVQCSHGATVAQLDPVNLHYLRTRGISRAEAELMLSYGFVNELVDGVGIAGLREYLRPLVAQRLSGDARLTRHLS